MLVVADNRDDIRGAIHSFRQCRAQVGVIPRPRKGRSPPCLGGAQAIEYLRGNPFDKHDQGTMKEGNTGGFAAIVEESGDNQRLGGVLLCGEGMGNRIGVNLVAELLTEKKGKLGRGESLLHPRLFFGLKAARFDAPHLRNAIEHRHNR